MNEGAAEKEKRGGSSLLCGLTHYLKDPSSLDLAISLLSPTNTALRYGTKTESGTK